MSERAPRTPEALAPRWVGSAVSEAAMRLVNEDRAFFDQASSCGGVFDGVGGRLAGARAALLAQDNIEPRLLKWPPQLTIEQAAAAMKNVFSPAHASIQQEAAQNPNESGMCSTACVVKSFVDEYGASRIVIGSVGDSRAVKQRADGTLEHLTVDDSLYLHGLSRPEALVRQTTYNQISSKQAAHELIGEALFNRRNVVTQVLGHHNYRQPQVVVVPLTPGERIILLTDGATGNLSDPELQTVLAQYPDSTQAARGIVDQAIANYQDNNHYPRARDNISAVVIGQSA